EEVAEWKLKDPNAKYRNYLLENGIATEEELVKLEEGSRAIIDDAVEFAKESPFADGAIAFQDNYAD
ncbi:pyruvate dehydrogenase, partial [Streptococcus danieliae]|nr:pyruvate dehydrogenase [Streptococcus danieliae]